MGFRFRSHTAQHRIHKKYQDQAGFTALELLVVLIIGLTIIAWGASRIDRLFSKSKLSEGLSDVNLLLVNTKDLKTNSGYGAPGTDLVPLLISTNGIPKNMTLTDGIPYNVWEGVVAVTSAGRTFSIRYASVPEDACIALATRTSRGSAFEKIQVNGAAEVIGEYTPRRRKMIAVQTRTIRWSGQRGHKQGARFNSTP